jgi:hypothetical protein
MRMPVMDSLTLCHTVVFLCLFYFRPPRPSSVFVVGTDFFLLLVRPYNVNQWTFPARGKLYARLQSLVPDEERIAEDYFVYIYGILLSNN